MSEFLLECFVESLTCPETMRGILWMVGGLAVIALVMWGFS